MTTMQRVARTTCFLPEESPLISVVLPIFNEEKNIPVIYTALTALLAEYTYEFIFVNDGSTDTSWGVITELAARDVRVKGINFSRNFGHQAALKAGYDSACGDAVITMDADMQHPPEVIPEMLEKWRAGAHIVYAQRSHRTDGFFKKHTARMYYKLLDAIADVKIPRHVADFRLVDKRVVQVIKQSKEKSMYFRGMVAWTGFQHAIVTCTYGKRAAGTTGYTWGKMFKLAFDGLTGFSLFPLKIAAFIGVFVIMSGCAMLTYITVDAVLFSVRYPLFKWLVTVVYIFMGIQFLLMWLLGEYIGRMYDQQRERPAYLIDQSLNINKSEDA